MRTYQLTMTENQARTVIAALDAYGRIHLGQIEQAVMDQWRWSPKVPPAVAEAVSDLLRLAGCWLTGRDGLREHPEPERAAYDIQQVVRLAIAKATGMDEHSVWHRPPLHGGPDPLPTCNVVESDS